MVGVLHRVLSRSMGGDGKAQRRTYDRADVIAFREAAERVGYRDVVQGCNELLADIDERARLTRP